MATLRPDQTRSGGTQSYQKTDPQLADSANSASPTTSPQLHSSAPDPEGEKYVKIIYCCGNYVCDGQMMFPYSRLRRFSKRARRELRHVGAACPDGGTIEWKVECQHYEQDLLLDKIFSWFRELPNTEPRSDFVRVPIAVHRSYHPAIDPYDEWIPRLSWKEIFLLDHTLDYLHLREPLDNKKVRRLIWHLLRQEELEVNPLGPHDVYLAWNLLQFKGDWVREATIYNTATTPSRTPRKGDENRQISCSLAPSSPSTSSTPEEELAKIFEGWEAKNSALMRNIIRKTVAHLERRGVQAFDAFVGQFEEVLAKDEPSDNHIELMQAFRKIHEGRNYRGITRPVGVRSLNQMWRWDAGKTES